MIQRSDITTFTDFHARLREYLDLCKSTGRPLFIANKGETEAVVLSAEAFDELAEKAELARSLESLDKSVEDIKAGRTRPAKQGILDVAKALNLKLDR